MGPGGVTAGVRTGPCQSRAAFLAITACARAVPSGPPADGQPDARAGIAAPAPDGGRGQSVVGVTEVAAGGHVSCLLLPEGAVLCWGASAAGDGTTRHRNRPTFVHGLAEPDGSGLAVRLAVLYGQHVCSILRDDTVACWGSNGHGQLGDGTFTGRLDPVGVGQVAGARDVAQGQNHTCALDAHAAVWCWGHCTSGQVGDQERCRCSIPDPSLVAGIDGVAHIAAGASTTCAVREDGTVWCWGMRFGHGSGPANYPTPTPLGAIRDARSLAIGDAHACVLLSDETVWCWGSQDTCGKLGDGTRWSSQEPVRVEALPPIRSVAAGYNHTCAVADDDSLWCWGCNGRGQLGDGTRTHRARPTRIDDIGPVTQVAGGSHHTCALAVEGTVLCWGANDTGQLGDGTWMDRPWPGPIAVGPAWP